MRARRRQATQDRARVVIAAHRDREELRPEPAAAQATAAILEGQREQLAGQARQLREARAAPEHRRAVVQPELRRELAVQAPWLEAVAQAANPAVEAREQSVVRVAPQAEWIRSLCCQTRMVSRVRTSESGLTAPWWRGAALPRRQEDGAK